MQILKATAILATLSLAGSACADIIEHAGNVPMTDTNWMQGFSVPQFDPALGTLTKVTWSLSGTLKGDMRFESLDGAPSTVNVNIQGELKLMLADLTPLLTLNPVLDKTDNVTEYDTNTDFDGTSGRSYLGLSDTKSDAGSDTSAAVLAFFTGVGTIDFLASATASTSATGAGNLVQLFTSQAGGDYKITFEYTAIPTPGSLGLMGLAGLTAARRRR